MTDDQSSSSFMDVNVKPFTWADIKYFQPYEFASPDEIDSGLKMNLAFVAQLDELRRRCGFPFVINSGYRTAEHNRRVGGVDESAHTLGLAADIHIGSDSQRFDIVREAYTLGFLRIGIAATYVHLDADISKPQGRMWKY